MRRACHSKGGVLKFLRPHSPVDNPIEHAFNAFKARWRSEGELLSLMHIDAAFARCFKAPSEGAAASAAANYATCGYPRARAARLTATSSRPVVL